MNTISIHQPQYLPWIPYFSKIKDSDIFVLLDDVQFQKNGIQNRNYIYSKNSGEQRLTMSVSFNFGDKINEVKIFDKRVLRKHWQTIEMTYRKAKFFAEISQILEPIYSNNYELLVDLNNDIIYAIIKYLNINTLVYKSSDLIASGEKSDLILSICKELGAKKYLTGSGGLDYLNTEDFNNHKIVIEQQQYKFITYPQISNSEFVSKLSIIDLLFNVGVDSINFL